MIQFRKDIAAVTVVFNPMGFETRYRLFGEFQDYMNFSKINLFVVEIAFKDRPFRVTQADNPLHLQLRTETELWHKERGLNLGIQELIRQIPEVEKICWIDADIRLSNPNWVNDTAIALDHYKIVQLFSHTGYLNPQYQQLWYGQGSVHQYINGKGYSQKPPLPLSYFSGGHPGLGWSATRQALEDMGGLLDFCVAGSGDSYMINAFKGNIHLFMRDGMSAGFKQELDEYQARADKYIKQNIGYINGIAHHYWHGKSEKRGYDKRWDIMVFHKFDPNTDIYSALNGLYKFAGNKPEMAYDLRLSMSERNEDSIDV